ncbi:MAG: insulinase family protein [Limnochordales bacterium]|nr:insulinase family protein [Limnochordales bacterium]
MYQKTVLPNGIRVISESIPYLRSFTVGFFYRVGSQDELPEENGLSHALEHLMFKGTPSRTARQIAEAFDAIGGQLNAFTTREYTCYYARGLDEYLPVSLEIMADMLLNANFPNEEVEKEKAVILEEIKMYDDEPEEVVHDFFLQTIWRGHPLGQTILGPAANVAGFTREQVVDFKERWYTADRLVVAAVGRVDHQQLVERIAELFGSLRRGALPAAPALPVADLAKVTYRRRRTGQVHLVLGAPAYARNDPRRFALFLLDTALGGGMSSRLFQGLREERGLVYNTYSFYSAFDEVGLVGAYAATAPERSLQVVDLMWAEFARVAREGLSPDELERARSQVKGNYVLALENPGNRMSEAARAELFDGRPWDPDEMLRGISQVTLEEVRAVAAELFRPERFTLVGLGPAAGERAWRQLRLEAGGLVWGDILSDSSDTAKAAARIRSSRFPRKK